MSLERWDPWSEMVSLRDAMDRLLHESFVLPSGGLLTSGRQSLPLDIQENDDNFVVSAWLPGVKPEDVQITVQGNTLTIRGETSYSETRQSGQGQTQGQDRVQGQRGQRGGNWILRERRHGTFYRTVQLPLPVNADAATTQFNNGELMIALPKAQEAKPKQIRISGGQSTQGPQLGQPGQA